MSEHPPQKQTTYPPDNYEDIRDLVDVGDGEITTFHRPDKKFLSRNELEMIQEHQDLIRNTMDDKGDNETAAENHKQAYNDILNPIHVAQLKDDIERAISRVGTKSKNVNIGLDLNGEKKAIREKYIKEYLHIGDPEKTRSIPDELHKKLEELLSHSLDELEAMATGDNDTDPKPTPTEDKPPTNPSSPEAPDDEPKPDSDKKEAIREEIEDIFEEPDDNGDEPNGEDENDEVIEGDEPPKTAEKLVSNPDTSDIMALIDNADKISNRHKRKLTLADLAIKHNGVIINEAGDYRGETEVNAGADAGVEAAQRLRYSKTRSKFNPGQIYLRQTKYHDWALNDMVKSNKNFDAADAIARSWRRNEALFQVVKATESDKGIKADTNQDKVKIKHILENMNGLLSGKYRTDSIAYLARQRDDETLLEQLDILKDRRKIDEALSDIAIKRAKTDKQAGLALAGRIHSRNIRDNAIITISKN